MYIKLKGITPREHQQLMKIKFWNDRFCDAVVNKENFDDCEDDTFEIFGEDCFDIIYTKSKGFIFRTGLLEIGSTKSATIVLGEDVD